jgi:hypothetical protein
MEKIKALAENKDVIIRYGRAAKAINSNNDSALDLFIP